MDPKQRLSGDQVAEMGLNDWRSLLKGLEARFRTGDFATGVAMVERVGAVAEELNHHPDLDLRYPLLSVRLSSHDVGGTTMRDVELARRISEIAAELGVSADPGAVQRLEFGLDTWDVAEIRPFWAAVLGMKEGPSDDEITDPDGNLPSVWFQECERNEVGPQRWHPDITVPPDVAQQRIEAAVAAGGTVVETGYAPRFTVLADAQGNKVCVCTHVGRPG